MSQLFFNGWSVVENPNQFSIPRGEACRKDSPQWWLDAAFRLTSHHVWFMWVSKATVRKTALATVQKQQIRNFGNWWASFDVVLVGSLINRYCCYIFVIDRKMCQIYVPPSDIHVVVISYYFELLTVAAKPWKSELGKIICWRPPPGSWRPHLGENMICQRNFTLFFSWKNLISNEILKKLVSVATIVLPVQL